MDFFHYAVSMLAICLGCGILAVLLTVFGGVLILALKGFFEIAVAYAENWTKSMKRKYGLD